jgi:hypothetical protein|nr:MAG TPA: Protein of unknown function (DUF1351) [Caudoviricetes sp.]
MNELKIEISQEPAVIRCNFKDVKAKLSEKMAEYQGAVFTEESKSVAKAELASLRKTREEVEKRRKEVKAQCLVPYNDFEEKVKELLEIIDEPICLIDSQLKEMEAERIRKRHGDVEKLYAECTGEWAEYLPLKEIYVKKWDNATTSLKQIEKELLAMAEKVASEIGIIRNTQSEVVEDALQVYQKSRDLGAALTRINIYEDNKKRALEAERIRREQEEEQRRQAEIERAREEERKKIEEIAKAREEERKKAEETLKAAAVATKDPEVPFFLEDEEDDLPFPQPQTVTAFYKVVATEEELERVEMAFNSIGIWFERRDA